MAEKFDFDAALKALQSGQPITGKDGVLAQLGKQLTEAALEAQRDGMPLDEDEQAEDAPDVIALYDEKEREREYFSGRHGPREAT